MRPRSDSADTNSEQPPPQEQGKSEQPGPRDCKPDNICNVAHDHPPGFSADTNSEQQPPQEKGKSKQLGPRDCKPDKICNVSHDRAPGFSDRHEVLDFYSLKLTRNELFKDGDFSFKGKLSGLIRSHDLRTWDFLYFYKVKPEDATECLDFDRKDEYLVTLNGPQGINQRLVDNGCTTCVCFAFLLDEQSFSGPLDGPEYSLKYGQEIFGEREVGYSDMDFNRVPFFNKPFQRLVSPIGEVLPINVALECAVMYPGAVASITVQILNKPAHVRSIRGSISARPCSFTDRIPLISKDETTLLSSDSTIQLKRRLLAVPTAASLVIEVGPLTDQDGKDLIPYLGATFVPSVDGFEVRTFKNECGDEHLALKIKWQNPMF